MNFETCPTCGTIKMELQPEAINGRQDFFYACKGAVTYDVENHEDSKETGNCENKFDWTHIYIEYGDEFDDSAKLVDERFFGWVEYDLYRKFHYGKWFKENPGKDFLDKKCLDEYFHNKEMYIKKMKDYNEELNSFEDDDIIFNSQVNNILKKNFTGNLNVGEVHVLQIRKFVQKNVEKIVYKIISSPKEPKRVGGYVIETNQLGEEKNSSIEIYDREVIEIIIKHETI